jgi:hypothetical protein
LAWRTDEFETVWACAISVVAETIDKKARRIDRQPVVDEGFTA